MRKEAQRGSGCRKRSDLDDSSRPDETRQPASTRETWSDASDETHHHELRRDKNTGEGKKFLGNKVEKEKDEERGEERRKGKRK